MRLCIKVGGALLEERAGRDRLAATLAAAADAGHELLVVHGGGRQIAALATRLGLEERRYEGLRVTDAETARVVSWVLAGEVNKALATALGRHGVRALGMCGADLGFFSARHKQAPVDLGYVGELHASDVHADAVAGLLAQGIVPVVATLAPAADGAHETLLNINADEAAGPIAAALECDELIVLSDVAGVLDADGKLLAQLDASGVATLIERGVVHGGMIPKVRAALAALDAGVPCIRILSGTSSDAIEAALAGGGTEFRP